MGPCDGLGPREGKKSLKPGPRKGDTLGLVSKDLIQVGVLAYLVFNLLVGLWAGRQTSDSEDFMVAGRNMPRWLLTFTLFATWFGGGTCLGAAGEAYSQGLKGIVIEPFGAALCLLISGLFFFRTMRSLRYLTVGDLFRERYGPFTERVATLVMLPSYTGWIASQLVAFSFVATTVTGVSTETGIVGSTLLVLVYTATGGMWAVAVTDFVQSLVLILGLCVLAPSVFSAVGGISGVQAALPAGHLDWFSGEGVLSWVWFLHSWMVIGLGDIPGQGLMGRALSAESDSAARQSGILAAFFYLGMGLIPVGLGLAGRILIPDLGNPETVLLELATKFLTPWGMVLFAGALISALMSSADSALLANASLFVENFYRPLRPDMEDREALLACRVAVVVSAVAACGIALWAQNVFHLMVGASAVGLVSLVSPFAGGLFWRGANEPGALASILGGLLVWIYLSASWGRGANPELPPVDLVAAGVSLGLFLLVSWATSGRVPPRELKPRPEPEPKAA